MTLSYVIALISPSRELLILVALVVDFVTVIWDNFRPADTGQS